MPKRQRTSDEMMGRTGVVTELIDVWEKDQVMENFDLMKSAASPALDYKMVGAVKKGFEAL